MRRVKNLNYQPIPEVIYIASAFNGFLFTTGLKAYVKINTYARRITRGYFVKFIEAIAGMNEDQAAELLHSEYLNNNIKWEL